jgi:hypothetical protein
MVAGLLAASPPRSLKFIVKSTSAGTEAGRVQDGLLTAALPNLILAPRDKFPLRGFKGNSGVKPGLPPQL